MEIEIKLEGFERLSAAMQKAPEVVQRELGDWATEQASMIRRGVTERTPRKTGLLAGSIAATPPIIELGQLGVTAIVGAPAIFQGTPISYAVPVELGTKPHVIAAKDGGSLRFCIGGVWVMVKSVNHPGTEGAHMFQDTLDASKDELQQSMNATVERILAQVFGAGS